MKHLTQYQRIFWTNKHCELTKETAVHALQSTGSSYRKDEPYLCRLTGWVLVWSSSMQKLSQENSVSLVTRLQVGRYSNGSLILSQGTRLPSKPSRPAVGPIRLILDTGELSLEVHLLSVKTTTHSLPLCANVVIRNWPPLTPRLHNYELEEPQEQDYVLRAQMSLI